jgi:hypothetical protein
MPLRMSRCRPPNPARLSEAAMMMRQTMKNTTVKILRACSLSLALAGSAALVLSTAMPTPVYADNGNGNGNGGNGGNGNGNGNGNGGNGGNGNSAKSEKSGGSSKSKSDKSTAKAEKSKKTVKKAKKKPVTEELGVSPSELGALNAAHASPTALANAAPNSRVGRIAAYKAAVLEGEELAGDLAEKQDLLESLTTPELAAAQDILEDANAEVVRLEQELVEAGGVDPVIEAELALARDEATLAAEAVDLLVSELDDPEGYLALTDEVAALEQQLEDQPELERSLLEAAANKPVTDEVEAAVKELLGL